MNKHTKKRIEKLASIYGQDEFATMVLSVIEHGKMALDQYRYDLGVMLSEAIMLMEREEIAGPDYKPKSPKVRKWASQKGSIFIGNEKVRVDHPRLRGENGEIPLKSYEMLKQRGAFSEALMQKIMVGISARRYKEAISEASSSFGISSSSLSNHVIEATSAKLKEFKERSHKDYDVVVLLLDTIHRGGAAFTVAIGIDIEGNKRNLGFWEGATENHAVASELLDDLTGRGLSLNKEVLYITDGGKGIIKALRDRFGKKLVHQRCTIHKDRNIQSHLAKKYRNEAHQRFRRALNHTAYGDAKSELQSLERWLRSINDSAANSLLEAFDEILMVHRLAVPAKLRRSLHTTNIIESTFARVRAQEKNIKNYSSSQMSQRWLAASLLHSEKTFHRAEGYTHLPKLREDIKRYHEELDSASN